MDKAKRTLWGLSAGHFFLDMYAAILIPLYPLIAERLNINLAQISFVIAIGHSISSILQPLFGYISDKLNKRVFMFFGLVFASLFMPLGFISPNSIILTLCLIFGMAGNAFYHPQVTTMIKDCYTDNIKLSGAMGLFLGLGTIGYAFGPYFSTYIIKTFGENNFIYTGLIGLLLSFVILFFVPRLNNKHVDRKNNFLKTVNEILKNKICIFLISVTIIKAALIMSFGTYAPFILKKFDFSLSQTGIIMTIFYIAGGLSMIFASKIEKTVKLKGIIIISYLPLLPLTLAFLFFLKFNKFISAAILVTIGFFILLAAGCVLAYAQKAVLHAGTISGIIQGFTLAIGSIILIPFGFIGEHFGIEYIFILITLIAFIISIYTFKIKSEL